MPTGKKDLTGNVTIKAIKGTVYVTADAGRFSRKQVPVGMHGDFPITSKRPITVQVGTESRATIQAVPPKVLIVEQTDDEFAIEDKVAAGKLRPLRHGKYSILLPPQK